MPALARLLLTLALLAGSAGAALATPPAQTAVFWRSASLTDPAGAPAGQAAPFSAHKLLGHQDGWLLLELADGRQARAGAADALVLPGAPADHRARLMRLAQARPAPELGRRLAAGDLAAGDGQRQVELAWGRPWRSYMVNLFQDEEHYVYRGPDGQPILLRFKAGRLDGPPPAAPPWVAGGSPPR